MLPIVFTAVLLFAAPAAAQMRTPFAGSVSENEGPIGESSRPVSEGSRPVGEGKPIGEYSNGPVHSGPMSDMNTRSMLSGPVSSMSSGPVRGAGRTLTGAPSMTEASAGAVKHDIDRPLGSRISAPLRELAPLQQQMKALRQQDDAAALEAAAAPVLLDAPDAEPEPLFDEGPAYVEDALDAEAPDGVDIGDHLEAGDAGADIADGAPADASVDVAPVDEPTDAEHHPQ
ncbi:MAG: hypothetical protein ABI629_04660 [bacterium]